MEHILRLDLIINDPMPEVFGNLRAEGLRPVLKQHGSEIRVTLSEDEKGHYALPSTWVGAYELAICAVERTPRGDIASRWGEVICSFQGEPIRPKAILLEANRQVLFSTPSLTTVKANNHTMTVLIQQHTIAVVGRSHALITASLLWKGDCQDLLDSPQRRFGRAADAAFEKAWCVECNWTHFAKVDYDPNLIRSCRDFRDL